MNSLVFEHNIECVMYYIKEHKNLPYEIIDIELRSIVENLFYQSLNDYRKTLKENQQLKKSIKLFTDDLANMTNRALQLEKQKDDVVEFIKENKDKTIAPYGDNEDTDYEVCLFEEDINEILRMLGEIDVED